MRFTCSWTPHRDVIPRGHCVRVQFWWFQNAYTATAINSTSFCTSARDALLILVENALRVSAINTVGDFVLFLAKVSLTWECKTEQNARKHTTQNALTLSRNVSGAGSVLHSLCWRPGSELPEGLHRLGPAAPHRLTLRLPGGPLLPVCLWKRGGRSLLVFRRGHKVQWRQPWPGVLHGQSLDGERRSPTEAFPFKKLTPPVMLHAKGLVQSSDHYQLANS